MREDDIFYQCRFWLETEGRLVSWDYMIEKLRNIPR